MITVESDRINDMGSRKEMRTHVNEYPKILRFFGQFFSVIFHPLFLPVYVTIYLVYYDHFFFTGFSGGEKLWVILRVLNNMVIFPAITVLLLKGVGFIKSVFLKTQRERIIPYVACGIFFFWMYLVFRNDIQLPKVLTGFIFGIFLAASAALIANIYYKISMHAIGAGGVLGLLIVIMNQYPEASLTLPLIFGILIAGIICTSRLIVSDHTQKELYMGFALGFACQVVSAVIN